MSAYQTLILATAVLLAVHLLWRRRFLRAREAARAEMGRLNAAHQRVLAETRAQQEILFDSMAEGLLLLDKNGRIDLANRAFHELFEITAPLHSKTILEALRLHKLSELVDVLGTDRQVLGYELKLSGPPERWVQVNGAAVVNSAGERYGTILVFHELTRLKQLENARKEFVANVSHELRTPLSLIKGYVETLLDGAKDDPALNARFLGTIDRNAERLKFLIEDLLTISQLEAGRLKLDLKPVELGSIASKVVEDLKAKAEGRGVRLVSEAPQMTAMADPGRLEQVLGNLVDNAIKYGRAGGSVLIGGRVMDDGQLELFVRDDGPGIPPESLGRVFERFYRLDKARSREQGGTGLGLSIVKHIVQNHGGRVWVESELGKGATFHFSLQASSTMLESAKE